jgi:hypothetical protein
VAARADTDDGSLPVYALALPLEHLFNSIVQRGEVARNKRDPVELVAVCVCRCMCVCVFGCVYVCVHYI